MPFTRPNPKLPLRYLPLSFSMSGLLGRAIPDNCCANMRHTDDLNNRRHASIRWSRMELLHRGKLSLNSFKQRTFGLNPAKMTDMKPWK